MEKYLLVKQDMQGGATLEAALKRRKMGGITYYACKKQESKMQRKADRALVAQEPRYIDITPTTQPAPSRKAVVILCDASDIGNILRGNV